ncbi:MFS transporter [Coprobacter sp.]
MQTKNRGAVAGIFFGYFIMGLVDVVGISANYIKADFSLSDSISSFLPLIAFISFAFLAVPSGLLMNRIGRKNSVLVSFIITLIALIIPVAGYTFPAMLMTFALVGIGNTVMQTSINPLLADVVSENRLTSSLTLGQFFRSISSTIGPILVTSILLLTGNWKNVFPVYAGITAIATLWLWKSNITERQTNRNKSSYLSTLQLLKDRHIRILFLALFFFVGIDVGMNVYVPEFLQTHCKLPLQQAGLGSSLYFVARIIGSLIGAVMLLRYASGRIYLYTMAAGVITFTVMMSLPELHTALISIFIIGLVCANVFSILLSLALQHRPDKANEVSGLMIMAVSGGAIIPLLIGVVNDLTGGSTGMYILLICFLFLLSSAIYLRKSK